MDIDDDSLQDQHIQELNVTPTGAWILFQFLTVALFIILRATTQSEAYVRAFNLFICIGSVFLLNSVFNGNSTRDVVIYRIAFTSVINMTGVAVAIALSADAGFLNAGLITKIAYCAFVLSIHFMVRHKMKFVSENRMKGKETKLTREAFAFVRFYWDLDLFAIILFAAGYFGVFPHIVSMALIMGSVLAILIMLGKMSVALVTSELSWIVGVGCMILSIPALLASFHFLGFMALWKK
ncbi:MAG: hypothetical protein LBT59_27080 [Clostridiales bacterium]|nr:hypothetical protein [Clostridiales bacterium]